jgi:hypothetical protein
MQDETVTVRRNQRRKHRRRQVGAGRNRLAFILQRPGEKAGDDVGGRGVGSGDYLAPVGNPETERLRGRQRVVVERLRDAIALADVEIGLLRRHRTDPGAEQPGADLRHALQRLRRGPVGEKRDQHLAPPSDSLC